jgi:hypothetical protein
VLLALISYAVVAAVCINNIDIKEPVVKVYPPR